VDRPVVAFSDLAGEGILSVEVQAPRVAAEFIHGRQFNNTALATLLAKTP